MDESNLYNVGVAAAAAKRVTQPTDITRESGFKMLEIMSAKLKTDRRTSQKVIIGATRVEDWAQKVRRSAVDN